MTSKNLYIAYGITIGLHALYGLTLLIRYWRVRVKSAQL